MTKTDEDIEREKEAINKMIGAKTAMITAIDRMERLENALENVSMIAADLGKRVGEDLYINTFYHGERDSGSKCVTVRSQLDRITEISAKLKR